jgi:hypothetical protein
MSFSDTPEVRGTHSMANRASATITSTVLLFTAGLLISLFQNCGGNSQIDEVGGPSTQGLPVIVYSLSSNGPPITSEVPFNTIVYTRIENVTANDYVSASALAEDCPGVSEDARIRNLTNVRLIAPGIYESRTDLATLGVGTGVRSCAALSNSLTWQTEAILPVGPRPPPLGSSTPIVTHSFSENGIAVTSANYNSVVFTRMANVTSEDYAAAVQAELSCPPFSESLRIRNNPNLTLSNGIYFARNELTHLPIDTGIRTCLAKNGGRWVEDVLPLRAAYFANVDTGAQVTSIRSNQDVHSNIANAYGPTFYVCGYKQSPNGNETNPCLGTVLDSQGTPNSAWVLFNNIGPSYLPHCTVRADQKLVRCMNRAGTFSAGTFTGYIYNTAEPQSATNPLVGRTMTITTP